MVYTQPHRTLQHHQIDKGAQVMSLKTSPANDDAEDDDDDYECDDVI